MQDGKFYKSKFTAPKKESKDKKLSANIQKFLQKQEQEQMMKAREAEEKRKALLALRDTKQKNKIKKMLKVIKSADKSVIADAKDPNDTAITLQGPAQPDEDDYGYVSHEANAFYSKLMQKYTTSEPEKPTASNARKKPKYSIKETLERTKNELNADSQPHQRRSRTKNHTEIGAGTSESVSSHVDVTEPPKRDKPKNVPKAPPLNFNDLLKIAEKKQHEPIEVVVPTAPKHEERLMSRKEKLEHEERMKYLKRRAAEAKNGTKSTLDTKSIPKVNGSTSVSKSKQETPKTSTQNNSSNERHSAPKKPSSSSSSPSSNSILAKRLTEPKTLPAKEKIRKEQEYKPVPQKLSSNTSNFKSRDADFKSHKNPVPKYIPSKRRIVDEDSEEEDSDMDSFIDDGDAEENVSSYIKEIFGYDKSRYVS